MAKVEISCTARVDLEDVLSNASAEDVVEDFRTNDDLASLLDAIGQEACMEHFGLVKEE